ncbi:hypothetical protein V5F89_10325 [Pelagerythrobacter marensis]|uniref:Thiamine pyrophosphate enzyme TPP-binding domain-containing protein n=1 Tax=Pelagerythrobacter marensis TaxID=543877 RepID=A0ABZ2D5S1_9SPHN
MAKIAHRIAHESGKVIVIVNNSYAHGHLTRLRLERRAALPNISKLAPT